MRFVKAFLLIATFLVANLSIFSATAYGQKAVANRLSPSDLVAALYRVHDQKRGPFFQTRNRALLDLYFEKSLADMIWKDAVSAKGEVGALDGDPLYDAQDMEIKKFAVGKASFGDGKARVNVTFTNFGQPKSFVFILVNGRTGWRINNIEYGEGRSLRGYLKAQ